MATDPGTEQEDRSQGETPPEDPERARIRAALLDLLAARPYPELTEEDLLRAAGVSRQDFARHYDNIEACFAELCQGFMREAAEQTFAAYAAEASWRDGIRAHVWASLDFLLADPLRARISVIDVNSGGDQVLAIRDLFMVAFTELVHLGVHESTTAASVPRERAEALTGASWELIAAPIRSGAFDLLPDAAPQVIYLVFLPYLGEAEARRELSRARGEVDRRSSL